ncbi:MAG: CBS domain-containing protein [Gemmatimonadales bacterium]|nr:MAG: CBS domain-containing protein [Gemmatimonadales bacterium]
MTMVRDLMKTEVATVSPESSVADLVEFLDRKGITGAPVVDADEALVGIVTVRDVLHLAREMGEVPEAMRWGMARGAPAEETGFLDPPVEGEFFAYYVTPGGGFVDVRSRIQEVPDKLFDGYKVADIMSTNPVMIPPEATLQDLARILRDRKIHRVLVVDNGQLVGIVTNSDILDHLADSE